MDLCKFILKRDDFILDKKATIRKIEQIITTQFNHEIKLKEAEVKEIDDVSLNF